MSYISTLVLWVTTDCNLRCRYCYANGGDKAEYMDWQVARQALDIMIKESRGFKIQFAGGEPLLNMELIEQVVDYTRNMKVVYQLQTNATLIDAGISRRLNPKWIESMQRHGYKGAGDLSRAVDIAFGWDATAEVLDDWMYEELAKKYALDKKMQDWLKEVNPYALQNIAERLLEAIQRDMWQATDEMKQELQNIYLDIEGVLEESSSKAGDNYPGRLD